MSNKLLSIIIVGRNDDYLGNYVYRLQSCLNFLAQNLKTLGRLNDVEVVLVDWNSQSEETLADILQVSPEAADILRFVIVPPSVAYARNPMVSFYTTCAVNVGVRRASGEFIMLADSDSMMPLPALESLLKVLGGDLNTPWKREEIIFPIPRHQIPGGIGARKPSVDQWSQILMRIFGSRRKESPGADCLGGYSAAQLMHRNIWFEMGGYNETLDRAWGWSDNELMLRVSQKYNWLDLGYYGVVAFHIEHHGMSVSTHSRNPDSINSMIVTYDLHPSPSDWGLKDVDLEEKKTEGVEEWRQESDYNASIGRQLTSLNAFDEVTDHPDFANFMRTLRRRYNAGEPFAKCREEAILATLAVANIESPLSVYYFGEPESSLLDAALDGAPGAEVFFIAPWSEGDVSGHSLAPDTLTSHLNFSTHRGFSRVVSLPADQAIKTIKETDPHALEIELAVLDREMIEEDFEQLFGQVLHALAENGAIILVDEKNRIPRNQDQLSVYIGRYYSAQIERLKSEDPGRRPPFQQSPQEASYGNSFTVVSFESGQTLVIRKIARDDLEDDAKIAAE